MNAYQYVMRYLAKYPKTEQELRIRLFQKWYSTEEVQRTFASLKKQGYLNDEMFTEWYLRTQLASKGKPIFLVKKKLEQKGISSELIEKYLTDNQDDIQKGIDDKIKKDIVQYKKKWVEWFDIIQKLLKKWYRLDDIKNVIEKRKK